MLSTALTLRSLRLQASVATAYKRHGSTGAGLSYMGAAIDPDFRERINRESNLQGAWKHLGMQLTKVEPGHVEITVPFGPNVSQQHGFFHGGVIAAVADNAGGFASASVAPRTHAVLAAQMNIHWIAPAHGSKIVGVARVVKPGRSMTVTDIHVYVEKEGKLKLCANGTHTTALVPYDRMKTTEDHPKLK